MSSYAVHPDHWLPDGKRSESLYALLQGPTPCDTCAHVARCAQQRLSCRAFAAYVQRGRWCDHDRDPSRREFLFLFRARDTEPQTRPGPPSGLQPQTRAKIEALRALRGAYLSIASAFAAVGLHITYWQRIKRTEPELAAHVRSLVARPAGAPRSALRARVLALSGPFKDYGEAAAAAGCAVNSLYKLSSTRAEVHAHLCRVVRLHRVQQRLQQRDELRTRILALSSSFTAFRCIARAAACRQPQLMELVQGDAEVRAHVDTLLGRLSITPDDRRTATPDAV
jgi:hypothetical protein